MAVCFWYLIKIDSSSDACTVVYTGLKGDQLNMAVCFWYLAKSDLSSVNVHIAYTGQVTFCKVPEKHGHVYLIGLYVGTNYLLYTDQ